MKSNSHLEWKVKYEPGTLSAKGYDDGGKLVAETKVETTGAPAAVQLAPDRPTIHADGEDVSVITVSVRDAQAASCRSRPIPWTSPWRVPEKSWASATAIRVVMNRTFIVPTWPSRTLAINDGWRWKQVTNVYASDLPEDRNRLRRFKLGKGRPAIRQRAVGRPQPRRFFARKFKSPNSNWIRKVSNCVSA